MSSISHIVNLFKAPEDSELFVAQPIVMESMKRAAKYCSQSNNLNIELLSAQYEEDFSFIPEGFKQTSNLSSSVQDFGKFDKQYKLPLISEILTRLYDETDSEYLIYTNADIIVMPHFYSYVNQLINEGYDAFVVNRRRIPNIYSSPEELPKIWSEIGKSHPGFDCFVFHRSLFPKFILGNVCIGVPFIEATLVHNLFAFASNFKLVDDQHLTTHIGMQVMNKYSKDYYWYNRNEFDSIIEKIKPKINARNLPYSEKGLLKRSFLRALNPSIFTKLALEIETSSFKEKVRYLVNEIRFKLLGPN